MLLAILLGAGKAIEAAEALEVQYLLGVDCVDVATLAADICELAIVILPMFADMELTRAQDTASLSKLTNYAEKLKLGLGDAVSQLSNEILGKENCIRLGDLRARLQETGCLMVSRALRKKAVRKPLRQPARLNSILKTPITSPLTSPASAQRSVRFLLTSAKPTE